MADMRVTLAQAREATADLADNMEALKRNFFLRGFNYLFGMRKDTAARP